MRAVSVIQQPRELPYLRRERAIALLVLCPAQCRCLLRTPTYAIGGRFAITACHRRSRIGDI
jgi:hypothetical protein